MVTIDDLYMLVTAISMVVSFAHGFSAGSSV